MKFGRVPAHEAEGAILAHSVAVGAKRLAKGTRLGPDEIAAAIAADVNGLIVVRLEDGDVGEDAAAARVGAALAGTGIRAERPVHGRVNLVAEDDGLVVVSRSTVDDLNAVDETITLGTLEAYTRVVSGSVVATIKVITFAAPDPSVKQCARIATTNRIALARFAPRNVAFIQTMLPGTTEKLLAKTSEVTRARASALGLADWAERRAEHDVDALAAVLRGESCREIILVAGASATTDRRDVIPAAIVEAGGEVIRLGMPVEPGNLLCLGRIGSTVVVGLPGCARSPKRNGFDWVLERLFAGFSLTSADLAAMGTGGLLADVPRPEPRSAPNVPATRTGAIVLAGGRSVRMGANKLLADIGGKPVLAHVLEAVAAAQLPCIVVTGNEPEPVRRLAGQHGMTTVHAERFAEGLSRSLAAGIAVVPPDWSAAVVLLGDMPEIQPDHLRAIADAARGDTIAVPVFDGKRGNPVAWGRRFFPRLASIEGDVGGKALFAEFAADVLEIEIGDDGILIDVDTPEALAAARLRHSS